MAVSVTSEFMCCSSHSRRTRSAIVAAWFHFVCRMESLAGVVVDQEEGPGRSDQCLQLQRAQNQDCFIHVLDRGSARKSRGVDDFKQLRGEGRILLDKLSDLLEVKIGGICSYGRSVDGWRPRWVSFLARNPRAVRRDFRFIQGNKNKTRCSFSSISGNEVMSRMTMNCHPCWEIFDDRSGCKG